MALYLKDIEIDRMVERLAALCRISKTEAVKHALQHELERAEAFASLIERGAAFTRALRARANPAAAGAADKAFIDGLYGEP